MAKTRRTTAKRSKPTAKLRMLIVEARFYDDISDELLRGATRVLDEADAQVDRITVPGALEIPAAIAIAIDAAKRKRVPYDGVVALGCVIYGETYHFEIVSNESARGLMDLSISQQLAIGNGILTVETEAQARVRANPDDKDKGGVAARAALTMVRLKQSLAGR
jgi:6,7-dimethyl-8-ribityllumazine synthase